MESASWSGPGPTHTFQRRSSTLASSPTVSEIPSSQVRDKSPVQSGRSSNRREVGAGGTLRVEEQTAIVCALSDHRKGLGAGGRLYLIAQGRIAAEEGGGEGGRRGVTGHGYSLGTADILWEQYCLWAVESRVFQKAIQRREQRGGYTCTLPCPAVVGVGNK